MTSGGPALASMSVTMQWDDNETELSKIRVTLGSTIRFSANFVDVDGAPLPPDDASIFLSQEGEDEEYPLTVESGANFTYLLDTDDYCRGLLYWTIRANSGDIKLSQDGYVNIVGNISNGS